MIKRKDYDGVPVYRETSGDRKRTIKYFFIPTLIIYLFFLLHLSYVVNYVNTPKGLNAINEAFENIRISPFNIYFDPGIVFKGLIVYILGFAFAAMYFLSKPYKYRAKIGDEQGSAKWNDNIKKYNKQYSFPKGETYSEITYKLDDKEEVAKNWKIKPIEEKYEDSKNKNLQQEGYVISPNMILSKNVYLSMRGKETFRNNNIIVIGGSGTGKSRYFAKPNLLNANASYIVTDPSGELLQSHGKYLQNMGYDIKVFNLVDMDLSHTYNPFSYIRDENGVYQMISTFILNTTPSGQSSSDPFWENAEKMLLTAICFLLYESYVDDEGNKIDGTFAEVTRLIGYAIPEKEGKETKLDLIFKEVEKANPESIALFNYRNFKQAAGDTAKSIVISAQARLFPFSLPKIKNLTSSNDINLQTIGERKTALFAILPSADTTFNWIVSLMYSQLFETLYYQAEHRKSKSLAIPVRFILDEFANIGKIPDYTNKLATMRKYDISCSVILQNQNQLEKMYEKDYKSLIGNCDTTVFLGSGEKDTMEYFSKVLGSTTIYKKSTGESLGRNKSYSRNEDVIKRELMTPDEIGVMDNGLSIITIRGERPFKDEKFPYEKHPMYKYCGDGGGEELFLNPEVIKEMAKAYEVKKESSSNNDEEIKKIDEQLSDYKTIKDWSNEDINIVDYILFS